LRTFGCLAHVKKIGPGVGKQSDKATKIILLGYDTTSDMVFRGGSASRPCLYKSCICRGGSQAAPINRFVGAAIVPAASIIPIYRGGLI